MTLVSFQPMPAIGRVYGRTARFINETEKKVVSNDPTYSPKIDISEDNESIRFFVELPGVGKEDVKVSVSKEKVLTVKGEKKQADRNEGVRLVRGERRYGSFERSFALPENTDHEKIDAKFDSGVLELTLPKIMPAKPEVYEININ